MICRTNIIVPNDFGLASEAVRPVNQMSCMIHETLLHGAMGFVIVNSNLPNQTDSYALPFLCRVGGPY